MTLTTTYAERTHWIEANPDPTPGTRTIPTSARATPGPAEPPGRAYGVAGTRARQTTDADGAWLDSLTSATLRTPVSADDEWAWLDLDSQTLSRISPARLLQLLSDLSPEVSKAVWDALRYANPGWTAKALRPSGAKGTRAQQKAVDDFMDRLVARHGSVDVVLGRLLISAMLRGGFLVELVLDQRGRVPLELATPDPASLVFQRVTDPEIGPVWAYGQMVNGTFRRLDTFPTIAYVPIDPLPGRPEGRAPAQPAMFAAVFLLAMLHDLRRVVQQQGYPRIDLVVLTERLTQLMPATIDADPEKKAAWIRETIDEISAVYAGLQPDDAYVHLDTVEVKRPVGTLDASSLAAVDGLITALERMLVRGLKTVPLLMGVTDGVSEANVRVQWRMYRATLRAFQHGLEQMLSRMLGLALEAQGIAARVEFRFEEADLTDRLIDEQTDQLRIKNARARYDNGWISQDEAARQGAGVETADQPEPRTWLPSKGTPAAAAPGPQASAADPAATDPAAAPAQEPPV